MTNNVMEIRYLDLTGISMSDKEDVRSAVFQLYAQINKWCDDHNYAKGLRTQSVLINKLMYYTAKEIKKKNKEFDIDTGWYLFGPCYEAGRMHEADDAPISIVPITNDVSSEVDVVCKELVPLYSGYYAQGGIGRVQNDFLRYIYSKKCDHEELRSYYMAKHELQCRIRSFDDAYPEIDPAERYAEVSRAVTDFDKSLCDGVYSPFVGLTEIQIDQVMEFPSMVEEYARIDSEGGGNQPFVRAIDFGSDFVLKALAHLNYSKTFDSVNPIHEAKVRSTHNQWAKERLKNLQIEIRRLYGAFGDAMRKPA